MYSSLGQDELRGSLDELKQALADEEQEEYEDDIEEEIVLLDEAVEEEEAFVIVEYGDTKDQLDVDAHALGNTMDELRKLDITKSQVKVRYCAAVNSGISSY